MAKKFGTAAAQENIERNKEYFINLQKCYNPSDVQQKLEFERSHSSDGILGAPQSLQQKMTDIIGIKLEYNMTRQI